MKVLEIEGIWSFGIMGSLTNITKVMAALEACEMVDVSFDHDPDGVSSYYAVPQEKAKTLTIKELPVLTKAEFNNLQKQREEEKEARAKEAEETVLEPPEVEVAKTAAYDPETDCGCNGNKTCSECS